MSTLKMPGGNNPLLLGGLALAAFWLYSRTASARTQAAPYRNRAVMPTGRVQTQPYATPTAVAGQLAGGLVGMLRGIIPGAAQGITVDTSGIALGNTTSRDALRAAERASNPGYYGWSGASDGVVESPAALSSYPWVDGLPSAAVYDPSDYMVNPEVGYWGIE